LNAILASGKHHSILLYKTICAIATFRKVQQTGGGPPRVSPEAHYYISFL
jgi:hypothetical protein